MKVRVRKKSEREADAAAAQGQSTPEAARGEAGPARAGDQRPRRAAAGGRAGDERPWRRTPAPATDERAATSTRGAEHATPSREGRQHSTHAGAEKRAAKLSGETRKLSGETREARPSGGQKGAAQSAGKKRASQPDGDEKRATPSGGEKRGVRPGGGKKGATHSRGGESRPSSPRTGESRASSPRGGESRPSRPREGKAARGEARRGEAGRGASSARGAEERATPARRAASEMLRRVESEGAFASVLLAHAAAALGPEDRALCYELTLGVLRWQLWLDRLTEHYAGRAVETLDAPVRRALRLGLYQLRFLTRVPQSAAVNESVKLTREAGLASAAGFVNAVLRRATREPDFDPAANARTATERVAVSTSHPVWLVARWAAAFGAAEAEAFARSNNRTPPVAFRVNPLRSAASEVAGRLRAAGVEAEASRVAPGAWRVTAASGGGEPLRALAAEGAAYTQDEASQLAAHVVGARAGERVLDACAAPGSKATQMAAETGDAALVVAGDLYGHRLRTVVESAARQGLKNVRAVAFDAEGAPLPFAAESFDRVLVDAPCTGTGTLRHNPEIRWRLAPSDIAELAARQSRILANCARAVRRGGRLVYSTCSVEPEENEAVVAAFLEGHADFRQVRADAPAALLTPAGAARTWPHRDDADGFFVAVMERS